MSGQASQDAIDRELEEGYRRHQAGEFREAQAAYSAVLARDPKHPDALHLLGVLEYQSGRPDKAREHIVKAIGVEPEIAEYHCSLGLALAAMSRWPDAIAAYRKALVLRPEYPEVLNNLGVALQKDRQFDEAMLCYQRALAQRPAYPEARCNLGNALVKKGKIEEALSAYRLALTTRPDFAEVLDNMGKALTYLGRIDEAISYHRQAVNANPEFADAHYNLGTALLRQHQTNDAIAALQTAARLRPDHAETHNNLAAGLVEKNQFDEAINACRRAMAMKPDYPDAQNNLASALKEKGRYDEAAPAYRRALELRPDLAVAHFNLGLVLLTQGHYAEGFKEYEWRWQAPELPMSKRHFAQPQWQGEDLAGRRIFIYAEQGLGDTVFAARFLAEVAKRGGKIICEIQPELRRLMQRIGGIEQWINAGDPAPVFDVHLPMMSLPRVLGITPQTIPPLKSYLTTDPAIKAKWKPKLAPGAKKLKVGLVWAGRPEHPRDHHRSIQLTFLAGLAQVPGTMYVSLQKGEAALQARRPPRGMVLADWSADMNDLADTAALIDQLDLVITVDTVIAHLAGALGKKVWIVLPFVADWRWMLDRTDTPWYPSARLFRQTKIGAWELVMQEVLLEVSNLAKA